MTDMIWNNRKLIYQSLLSVSGAKLLNLLLIMRLGEMRLWLSWCQWSGFYWNSWKQVGWEEKGWKGRGCRDSGSWWPCGHPQSGEAAVLYSDCCFCCLVAQSCLILCNPMDWSLPGSFVHGISQAGILDWVAMPSSRRSSWHRDRTRVSCTGRRVLYHWATREAHCTQVLKVTAGNGI